MKRQMVIVMLIALASVMYGEQQAATADASVPMKVRLLLADKSQVMGTPLFSAFDLTAAYGKVSIPIELIAAVNFGGWTTESKCVKVNFVNKDILTGILDGSSLQFETVFGKVHFDYSKIKSLTFFKQGTIGQQESGLLLHVPLDAEDTNLTMFNASMETKNISIVEGRNGNAMLFGSPDASATIDLPFSPYTMQEGTIEFWAKLPEPNRRIRSNFNSLWFFYLKHEDFKHGLPFTFSFNENSGEGRAGLVGVICGFSHAGSHAFGNMSSVASTKLLGDTPDGWHHYSFLWKWAGFEEAHEFAENQKQVILIAVDGKVVASGCELPTSKDYFLSNSVKSKCRFVIHDGWRYANDHPVMMADLKIWAQAQLPPLEQGK